MRVLRIQNDVNRYQYFLPANPQDTKLLQMDGTPKAESWTPPEVYIYKPLHKPGALYNFGSDLLIFSPIAAQVLWYFIRMAGEVLPLPHEGTIYRVLNVTNCINCLDSQRSEWITYNPNTRRGKLRKYEFFENRFSESPIFKIPENPYEIFIADRPHLHEDDFFESIKRHNLEGFKFTEVWRSDENETSD